MSNKHKIEVYWWIKPFSLFYPLQKKEVENKKIKVSKKGDRFRIPLTIFYKY